MAHKHKRCVHKLIIVLPASVFSSIVDNTNQQLHNKERVRLKWAARSATADGAFKRLQFGFRQQQAAQVDLERFRGQMH